MFEHLIVRKHLNRRIKALLARIVFIKLSVESLGWGAEFEARHDGIVRMKRECTAVRQELGELLPLVRACVAQLREVRQKPLLTQMRFWQLRCMPLQLWIFQLVIAESELLVIEQDLRYLGGEEEQ